MLTSALPVYFYKVLNVLNDNACPDTGGIFQGKSNQTGVFGNKAGESGLGRIAAEIEIEIEIEILCNIYLLFSQCRWHQETVHAAYPLLVLVYG